MERRTVVAAAMAAGMCLAAGAFTLSTIADGPPAASVAHIQPLPSTPIAPAIVHQVATVDDVVVVTTVPVEPVRAIHPEATGSVAAAAQLTLGGQP